MNTPRFILTHRIAAAAAAVLLFTPALHAADRFWVDADGGSFNGITSWSTTDGGASGASVPGAADVAKFTLNSTYTVTFSAAVTNFLFDVSNSTVTFDLNGFTYTNTNSSGGAFIGYIAGQTGRLTVKDGTLAVDTTGDNIVIGNVPGSTGFLTISTGGRLGDGTLRPDLFIGDSGTGTLTVNDNGQVDAQTATLGNSTGSAGTMTITGPNAVVDLSSSLTVGSGGAGTVTISNGGTLSSAGTAFLGSILGADGALTVTGAGSSFASATNLVIGSSGDGTLNVTGGGLATTAGIAFVGSNATGFGTATVSGSGSRWDIASSQFIGNSGIGVMTVSSGGVVTTTNATLGSSSGSEGRATVTGAGSQWTLSSSLIVGSSSTGELTISAGGEVSTASVTLGNSATGIGELTLTGAGSKLTTSGAVTVASSGFGTLAVSAGAELVVGTNLTINNPAGAQLGTLTLDGGSIYVGDDFTNTGLFNFRDGLLRVKGDFQARSTVGDLYISGADNDALPTLELIGSGVTTNVGNVIVGFGNRGQLLLRQGRVLNIGSSIVAIGYGIGSEGTVSVQSGAQLLTTGNLDVGGVSGNAGGTGTLNIAGGTVDVGALELFTDGTINLSSGALRFDTPATLDGQFNWTGGTVRIDASLTVNSFLAAPLLGLDGTLDAGQALAFSDVTVATPIVVDGGALSFGSFFNNSTIEVRSGSATVAGAITNNAGAQLFVQRDMSVGGIATNASGARITLVGGTGRLLGANTLTNSGLITGDGTIAKPVTNSTTGELRAEAGKTLVLTGANGANAGKVNLQGGVIEFSQALTNGVGGFISGRGALHTAGLTNSGAMAFSGGTMDIHGDVTNASGGRIVTSGAGSTTTFFDDLDHNGTEIFTGANASTVIFGASTGAGPFTGTGTVYSNGDLRPGNSPATVSYGGSLVLGNGTLTMELGGFSEGTQYDSLHIASSLTVDGILTLALINGYTPALGDMFDLVDAASISGSFDSFTLPALAQYLAWNTSALYTTGEVSVQSTLTPIEQWRLLHFGTPANSGDGADSNDFDHDGAQNLLEYALALDPLVPSADGLPALSVVDIGATDHIALTITRPLSATDITYQIEVGGALVSFVPGSSYSSGGDIPTNANTTQVSRTPAGPGYETIVVRDNTALAAAPRRFLRLKVTNP